MDSVLKLRPEELFFLGDLLDGQYIDYAYVEAMHEIEKNYDAMRAKALEDLARAGIIRKRFSGAVTVMPEAEKLLRNVFGSEVSGEILLGIAGDSVTAVSHRYHFGEDSITEIVTEGGDFTVSEATGQCCLDRGCDHDWSFVSLFLQLVQQGRGKAKVPLHEL